MSAEATGDGVERAETVPFRSWLWDHIGRITGTLIGLGVIAVIAFLAAIGFAPAVGLLIVVVVGIAIIALGGRLRKL